MAKLIDQCYLKAIGVLKKNSTKFGFKASVKKYNQVWARDGAITVLGANLIEDKELLKTSRLTLETLKNHQTSMGQIPNNFALDKKRSTYYATDANPWWIIGVENYFTKTKDSDSPAARKFLDEFWPSVKKAIQWLKYQIKDQSCLLDTPETSDWMDTSIGRRGKVFYTNCLYWKAIESFNKLAKILGENKFNLTLYKNIKTQDLNELKQRINLLFWPAEKGKEFLTTYHKEFFEESIYPWREHYTNYLAKEFYEDRCDVFANILAILFGITNKNKQEKILNYFFQKRVSDPYPVKVLNPPIFYPDPTWNPKIDLYVKPEAQNIPFHFHNAAIWPYIGGFYILMLVKCGENKKAQEELEKLAKANKIGKEIDWEFNEWLHGKSGKPQGAVLQAWSAAGYIIAYKAVKEGKLIF